MAYQWRTSLKDGISEKQLPVDHCRLRSTKSKLGIRKLGLSNRDGYGQEKWCAKCHAVFGCCHGKCAKDSMLNALAWKRQRIMQCRYVHRQPVVPNKKLPANRATNFTQTPKKKKNEFWNCHLAMLGRVAKPIFTSLCPGQPLRVWVCWGSKSRTAWEPLAISRPSLREPQPRDVDALASAKEL